MTYEASLSALADPTRRKIFEVLRTGPKAVGEIARLQTVSRPAVSQHLRVLETARLVAVNAEGNRNVYAIRTEGLVDLRRWLEGFWSDVLASYALEIERQMNPKKGN